MKAIKKPPQVGARRGVKKNLGKKPSGVNKHSRRPTSQLHKCDNGRSADAFGVKAHSTDTESAIGECKPGSACREAGTTGGNSLPCLNSINFNEQPKQKTVSTTVYALTEEGFKALQVQENQLDSEGRFWDGQRWFYREKVFQKIGQHSSAFLTAYERKKAFALKENAEYLIRLHGIERVGFLTLTFKDNLTEPKEAQRRFKSFQTGVLKKHFKDWIVVLEFQKRGAIHFHLLVVTFDDIRTGFDFDAIERRDYASASRYLKGLWRVLRKLAPRYHFGRTELLPIRKTGEGVATYVGKYIEKGTAHKPPEWKRQRTLRYSQGWAPVKTSFSWNSPGARKWRSLVAQVADNLRVDQNTIKSQVGPKWAYWIRKYIEENPEASPVEIAYHLRCRTFAEVCYKMRSG